MFRYAIFAVLSILFFYEIADTYTVRFTAPDGFYLAPVEDKGLRASRVYSSYEFWE